MLQEVVSRFSAASHPHPVIRIVLIMIVLSCGLHLTKMSLDTIVFASKYLREQVKEARVAAHHVKEEFDRWKELINGK